MEKPTGRKRLMPRARYACLRCRRQKLRCDNLRPCALCVRSLVECKDQEVSARNHAPDHSRPKRKPLARQTTNDGHLRDTGHASGKNGASIPVEVLQESQPQELHVQGETSLLSQERPSSYGLVDQLFRGYDSGSAALIGAEAIPGATQSNFSSTALNDDSVPIRELVGISLPPAYISWAFFEAYVKSVHWFMLIFHEPSLRDEMSSCLRTGQTTKGCLSNLILILVVLLIGAKYAVDDDFQRAHASIDVDLLQTSLLTTIESKFLAVLDQGDVGAVQVCILLSSFYFYHGRPNRCLAINSAAIRMAQNMKFHRENSWGRIDAIERESRRRAWWALYVADGYASITYGATTVIKGSQCQVAYPRNIDDTSDQCPGFHSSGMLEAGTNLPVTTLSYQRYKFTLYQIAEPIMGEIYFHNGRPVQDLIQKVKEINRQLLDWEKSVPPELRPTSFSSLDKSVSSHPLTRIFQLQAVALQLSYDNIQLVLHRPLLVYNGVLCLASRLRMPKPPDMSIDFREASKELCWNSACRIARIDEYLAALAPIQNLYITSYTGIQTFTAGVMLGIFALSKPFTSQAQEAKQNIGRLVKMPKLLGYRTIISDQTGRVLQRLLRLILDEELKALTSDDDVPAAINHSSQGGPGPGDGRPTCTSRSDTSMSPAANQTLSLDVSRAEGDVYFSQLPERAHILCGAQTEEEHSTIRSTSARASLPNQRLPQVDYSFQTQDQRDDSEILDTTFTNQSTGTSLFDSEFLSELDDLGQGWMWGDCHQFP